MRWILILLIATLGIAGCGTWGWTTSKKKRSQIKEAPCIRVINDKYIYSEDCKYFDRTRSDSTSTLPP